jgi:hypothetical protein
MTHPKLWGTTDTRNGLPTTTKESPDFSHGGCQKKIIGNMKITQTEMMKKFQKEYSADELLEIFKIDEKVLQELYDFTNKDIRNYILTKSNKAIEIMIRPKAVMLYI